MSVCKKATAKQIFLADMSLIVVAFFWGAGIPLSALLARELTPLWGVAVRTFFSAIFLALFFPKKIITATLKDWKFAAIQAAIMVVVFVTMTFGLYYSTASKQAFIGGLNVIMVPIFVWALYGDRPSSWIVTGAGLTTAGLLVMSFTPGMAFNFGDFLSFIMAIFYAVQCIGAAYFVKRVDPVRLVTLHIILTAIAMTALALVFEPIPNPAAFTWKIWAAITCVSLINTTICFIVQFKAQQISPEAHVAVICSLESLFGYILAVLSGQDPFHFQGAIGGLMIFTGMIATELELFLKKD